MRPVGLILCFALLAACDPSGPPRAEPSTSTSSGSGISVSGYGRVGISTRR